MTTTNWVRLGQLLDSYYEDKPERWGTLLTTKSVFEKLVDRRRACVIDVEDVSMVDGWHESGVIPRI
jgi:hypothetical protein